MKGQEAPTSLATRREFLSLAAAAALTGLPQPATAGAWGRVGPSEKIALACIGVGAQGTRVMMDFLKMPEVEVVAVCDVNREGSDYSESKPCCWAALRCVWEPRWNGMLSGSALRASLRAAPATSKPPTRKSIHRAARLGSWRKPTGWQPRLRCHRRGSRGPLLFGVSMDSRFRGNDGIDPSTALHQHILSITLSALVGSRRSLEPPPARIAAASPRAEDVLFERPFQHLSESLAAWTSDVSSPGAGE